MHTPFTIKDSLTFAWKKMSEHFWFLVLLTLAFVVVTVLIDNSGVSGHLSLVSQILRLVLGYFATFTFVRVMLKIYKGHTPTWNDVVDFDLHLFSMYVVAAIIFTFAYIIGFALFFIPGIIVLIRGIFFAFALIDNKLEPIPAIKKSLVMTRGRFWHLFGFSLILALINCIGAGAFGFGLLITVPFCLLATVYVYEKIKAHHAEHHAGANEHQHAPQV